MGRYKTRANDLIDSAQNLEDAVGIKPSDEKLCNRVKLLEIELFGSVKIGSMKDRIES